MGFLQPDVVRQRWLSHVLCRRYGVVAFSPLLGVKLKGLSTENRTVWWAFGCLVSGESEILGSWTVNVDADVPKVVFGDLYSRGAEFIRCGLGDLKPVEAAFQGTFRNATLYPSIEQAVASAVAGVRPMHRTAMDGLLRALAGAGDELASTALLSGNSSEFFRQKYPGILAAWDEAVAGFQPLFVLPEPYRRLVRSVDRTAMGLQERLTRSMDRHGPFADSADAFDFVVDWLMRADLRLERDRNDLLLARGRGPAPRRSPLLSAGVGATAPAQGTLP